MSREVSFSPPSSASGGGMRSPLMHDLSLDSSLEHSLTRPAKQPPRSTTQKVHVLMYESTTLEEFTDEEDVTEQSLPGVRTQDYFQLGLIASALVAAWVFNNVSWIYLSDRAGQTYAFFLDQWTSLLVILMQLPIFLYQWLIAKTIPREELTAIPFLALLLMGSVDAVYDCFVTVGSPYTPGPFQTILFQLPIPITLLLAYFLQHKRFRIGQYLGATIIFAGAALTVGPACLQWMRGQTILDSDGNAERIKGWSVFFYFVGVLCYAANTLYKESYLHTRLVDVWFLSVTVSAINFCVTFAIIPLLWIPGMGLDTPSTTFPHLWAGVKCVFLGRSDMDEKAVCEGLWWLALVNVTANVVVNLLVLLLIKRGSALLMQVASGIQLPVVNLFYACRFIMTSQYVTPMDLYMWLGLALVTVGFFIYSFLPLGPRVNPNGEELGGKAGSRRSGGRKRNPFLESVPGADTPLMSPAESEKPATTTRLTTHYESRTLQAI